MKVIDKGNEIILIFYPTINKAEKLLNLILLIVMGLSILVFTYLLFFVESRWDGNLLLPLGLVFAIVVFRRYLILTYSKEFVLVNRESITIKKGIWLNMKSKTNYTKNVSDFEISPLNADIDAYDFGTNKLSFRYKSEQVIVGKSVYSWEVEKALEEVKRIIG